METSSPRKLRLWIPVLLILAYGSLVAWARISEHMMGTTLVFLASIVGCVLLWLWWTFLSGLRLAGKLLSLILGIGLIAFLALSLRYEGSTDGSGVPRLVWKWAPTLDQQSKQALATNPTPVPASESNELLPALRFQAMDSPEYYGPRRNGVIEGIQLNAESLSTAPETLWKQPIGLGWSSFAVKDRTAVTQEQRGDEEWVSAYDLETGTLQWHYAQPRRFREGMGGDGPRATPSIHGDTVFALGATGILDALTLQDGTPRWSYDVLDGGRSNLTWGKAASPLYLESENLVIVTGGSKGGPTVQAVNAEYGEAVWTWGTDAASYASPVEATLHGVRQIVVVNENTVVGLSPDSGTLLWSFDWPAGMMESTPKSGQPNIINGSKILITASYGIGSILFEVTKDDADNFSTSLVWRSRNRMKTKFSSATVRGQYAYGLDEGFFACIDLQNGKRLWKDGRYGYGQNILVGDAAIVQAENGDIVFVEASPEAFNEIARYPALEGTTWNIPTLAGEYLLLRNDREAACLRLTASVAKTEENQPAE